MRVNFAIFLLNIFSIILVHSILNEDEIIARINEVRRRVTPTGSDLRRVEWDDCLAEIARNYLNTCPGESSNTNLQKQAEDAGCVESGTTVGESGFYSEPNGGTFNSVDAINLWAMLSQIYNYQDNVCAGVCDDYKQLVQADMHTVGCAEIDEADCGGGGNRVICYFGSASGDGRPYSTGVPCSDCEGEWAQVCEFGLCVRSQEPTATTRAETTRAPVTMRTTITSTMPSVNTPHDHHHHHHHHYGDDSHSHGSHDHTDGDHSHEHFHGTNDHTHTPNDKTGGTKSPDHSHGSHDHKDGDHSHEHSHGSHDHNDGDHSHEHSHGTNDHTHTPNGKTGGTKSPDHSHGSHDHKDGDHSHEHSHGSHDHNDGDHSHEHSHGTNDHTHTPNGKTGGTKSPDHSHGSHNHGSGPKSHDNSKGPKSHNGNSKGPKSHNGNSKGPKSHDGNSKGPKSHDHKKGHTSHDHNHGDKTHDHAHNQGKKNDRTFGAQALTTSDATNNKSIGTLVIVVVAAIIAFIL